MTLRDILSARPRTFTIISFLLIAAGAARIIATYGVFNHTMDEPTHIACGLEWLTEHTYTIELQHPPLARIAAAIGPYFAGAHHPPKEQMATKGPLVLYDSPSYHRTLSTARAGELPFFVLASVVVWLWARRLHGHLAAMLGVLLFTTLPPVLAHAGLATTDMAVGAMVPTALYALVWWLDGPQWSRSAVLGAAMALGLLSKFTFIVFFPICAAVVLVLHGKARPPLARCAAGAAIAFASAFVIVWAAYWFSIPAVPTKEGPGGMIALLPSAVQSAVVQHASIPLPTGEVYMGIVEAREHNFYGHLTYLLGERSTSGWWYFFPVVLANKTPLAFLALSLLACGWLVRSPREHWAPLVCAAAILVSVLPSRIDLGIRHILAIYPLLAIPAGLSAARLLASGGRVLVAIGTVLVAWQVIASGVVHPNYIAYFNELSLGEPEYVRVDSDLDWGQSVEQLVRWVKARNIQGPIGYAGFGSTDPRWHGLNYIPVSPWKPATGWVAVSATERMLSESKPPPGARGEAWQWLDVYEPSARVGAGSVLVYYIPNRSPAPESARQRSDSPMH